MGKLYYNGNRIFSSPLLPISEDEKEKERKRKEKKGRKRE
jgi:hypothetical protein